MTISTRIPRVTQTTTVRGVGHTTLTASSSANVAGAFDFRLANANVGGGFYDLYKIEAIRWSCRPQNNAIGLVTNSTTTLVELYCAIDYDDATTPSSAATLEAYSTCLVLPPGQSCSRTFKPRMAVAAYQGAFTGYASFAPTWIDVAYPNVQHYGVKYFIPQATALQTQLQSWDITIEYFFTFKKSI